MRFAFAKCSSYRIGFAAGIAGGILSLAAGNAVAADITPLTYFLVSDAGSEACLMDDVYSEIPGVPYQKAVMTTCNTTADAYFQSFYLLDSNRVPIDLNNISLFQPTPVYVSFNPPPYSPMRGFYSNYLYISQPESNPPGVAFSTGTLQSATYEAQISGTVLGLPMDRIGGEWETPPLTSTQKVYFGANGAFNSRTITPNSVGTFPCNTTTFGDPIVGTLKSCYVMRTTDELNSDDHWVPVGNENGGTTDLGIYGTTPQLVRYGADGNYNYRMVSPNVAWSCNNTTFGDPIYGTVKACQMYRPSVQVKVEVVSPNPLCLTRNQDSSSQYSVISQQCNFPLNQVWTVRPSPIVKSRG